MKLLLVGAYGVGKKTYISKLGGDVLSTINLHVTQFSSPFFADTEYYSFRDFVDDHRHFGRVRVDCAIAAFDLGSICTLDDAYLWVEEIFLKYPGIPIVLVGMKADRPLKNSILAQESAMAMGIPYVEVSALTSQNLYAPLEILVDALDCHVSETK